jgi:Transposase DDE domain
MATSKGVIQGYTGVAAVDGKHQIIVEAQAHGTGSEQELLVPVIRAMKGVLATSSLISADAGYHSEANLKQLSELNISALIADNGMRRRDQRFATQGRHKTGPDPLYDKSPTAKPAKLYTPQDFDYDPVRQTCVCPAGKKLYRNGSDCVFGGYAAPCATACPATGASIACDRPRPVAPARSPSSRARPPARRSRTPTG